MLAIPYGWRFSLLYRAPLRAGRSLARARAQDLPCVLVMPPSPALCSTGAGPCVRVGRAPFSSSPRPARPPARGVPRRPEATATARLPKSVLRAIPPWRGEPVFPAWGWERSSFQNPALYTVCTPPGEAVSGRRLETAGKRRWVCPADLYGPESGLWSVSAGPEAQGVFTAAGAVPPGSISNGGAGASRRVAYESPHQSAMVQGMRGLRGVLPFAGTFARGGREGGLRSGAVRGLRPVRAVLSRSGGGVRTGRR